MKRRIRSSILILALVTVSACGPKPATDPSTTARFNSISARAARVATIYAPAAQDALPFLAETLKWDATKVAAVKAVIQKVQASASSVSRTLGNIVDAAITPDQKLIIGPLLTTLGNGLSELDSLNLFNAIEGSKLETGIRVASLALKTIGRLLSNAAL